MFTEIVSAGAPASARPGQWYFPVPTSTVHLVLGVLWLVAVLVLGLGLVQLGFVRWTCTPAPLPPLSRLSPAPLPPLSLPLPPLSRPVPARRSLQLASYA